MSNVGSNSLVPAATAYSPYGNHEGIVALHEATPSNKVFLFANNQGICNSGSFSTLSFTSSTATDKLFVLGMYAGFYCSSSGSCSSKSTEVNMLILEKNT